MKASPAGILYGHKESNTGRRTLGRQFFSGYGEELSNRADPRGIEK